MRAHWLAVVLTAGGLATPAAARPKPKALADFLPAKIGGMKRYPGQPLGATARRADGPQDAHAAYRLPGQRALNVSLMWVRDPDSARAQFKVHAVGETYEAETTPVRGEGFEVDGVFVQCMRGLPVEGTGGERGEARALVADRVLVVVSVERPTQPNEPVEWMRKLDLRGIAGVAELAGRGAGTPERRPGAGMISDDVGKLRGAQLLGVIGVVNEPPPPLRLVIEHVDHGNGSRHVHARLENDSHKPIEVLLGPEVLTLTIDGAHAAPIAVERPGDSRPITRVLQPGLDYLVELGPDDRFRGKKLEVRYRVDGAARGDCADCWTGDIKALPLTVPAAEK